jgi:parallel beta helix pectate lyase-like protein
MENKMDSKILILSGAIALASAAHAQIWVSASVGNDANTCSRGLPCRTFQKAINVAPLWGTINVLDPGDYGSMTISQAVTVDGGGLASNVSTSYNNAAIAVQTPSGEVVQLRNMSIHGNGAYTGISYTGSGQLVIENLKINGFGGDCINAGTSGPGTSDLVIKDTSIDNCSSAGIEINGPQTTTAEISNTHVHYATYGLNLHNGIVHVSDSSFSSPGPGSGSGIIAGAGGGPPVLMLDNCRISGYAVGIVVSTPSVVQLSRSTIMNTGAALQVNAGGTLISNGNNSFLNNTSIGSFTKTVPLM